MAGKYISLTAIGKDRPGLVSAIAKVLYEYKCNIEDSTMTILHGQFAMILILSLPKDVNPKELYLKLQKSSRSLSMSFSYSELTSFAPKRKKLVNPYIISVYGADKPGIVYGISSFLAGYKINITDVQTAVSKSKGKKTYIMIIEAEFPKKIAISKIQQELLNLAKSMNVAVSVNQAESADI
ncbi:MAG: ACT domain-containing protein [Endomicrobia bacterium]|nr:ACT domain-containing protein [Endomicrobiia bacterium]